MNKLSYALGLGIGQQLKQMAIEGLNVEDFSQAIKDVIEDNELQIQHAEAKTIVNNYFMEKENQMKAAMAEQGKVAKQEGEQFLKENAQKEGIVTTASGLQYQVLKEGNGKKPKATDQVRCHYVGTLINGQEFDSSYARNEPAVFPLNGVIPGWTEGVQLMQEGAKYRFYIPYMLAYGEAGAGAAIPPFSTLIFDVELLEVL